MSNVGSERVKADSKAFGQGSWQMEKRRPEMGTWPEK